MAGTRILLAALLSSLLAGCSGGGGGTGSTPTPTPTPAPTTAGLHVIWTLIGQVSGNPLACAAIIGATNVDVLATSTTNGALVFDNSIACTLGTTNTLGYSFGSYTANVSLLNGGGLSIASASPVLVTLGASPCDQIVSGSCLQNLPINILIPGQ